MDAEYKCSVWSIDSIKPCTPASASLEKLMQAREGILQHRLCACSTVQKCTSEKILFGIAQPCSCPSSQTAHLASLGNDQGCVLARSNVQRTPSSLIGAKVGHWQGRFTGSLPAQVSTAPGEERACRAYCQRCAPACSYCACSQAWDNACKYKPFGVWYEGLEITQVRVEGQKRTNRVDR